MLQIILGVFIVVTVIVSTTGCSSLQYPMKECHKVVDDNGQPTGENLCKKLNWWQ